MVMFSEKYGYIQKMSFHEAPAVVIGWNIFAFISRSMVGASLVLLGEIIGKNWTKLSAVVQRREILIGLILIVIGTVIGLAQGEFVDLHFSFIRNPVLFFLSAIATTMGLVAIGSKVRRTVLSWLGQNSLYIMFCQIIQDYWCRGVNKIIDMRSQNIVVQYGIAFISLAAILLLSVAVTQFMIKFDVLHIGIRREKHDF